MNPFHPDDDQHTGVPIEQDDLIAFHLRDISRQKKRAILRALQTNPRLHVESMAIASTLRAFPKHEAALPLDAAALDRHWLALRNTLPMHVPPAIAPRSFFPRWAFPALAGSALAATTLILSLHHNPHTTPITLATATPPSVEAPAPGTVPSINSVPATVSVPPFRSIHPISIPHSPALIHIASHPPQPSTPIASTRAQIFTAQPIPQPHSATSAANTTLAATQHPISLPSTTPSSPTALANPHPSRQNHHDHTTDLTLAALANITPSRSFTVTTGTGASTVTTSYLQATSPTLVVLASFHQQFRRWLGYRVTATHSEPTFEYTYSPTTDSAAGIIVPENAYEFSATYVVQGPVVQGPRHRHISTSAEAGAGVLVFHPTNPNSILGVSNSVRSTAVLGVSAELALTKHWALHAGYRTLLYKSPPAYLTYDVTVPTAGNLTLSNEPVIGLTYRFHAANE